MSNTLVVDLQQCREIPLHSAEGDCQLERFILLASILESANSKGYLVDVPVSLFLDSNRLYGVSVNNVLGEDLINDHYFKYKDDTKENNRLYLNLKSDNTYLTINDAWIRLQTKLKDGRWYNSWSDNAIKQEVVQQRLHCICKFLERGYFELYEPKLSMMDDKAEDVSSEIHKAVSIWAGEHKNLFLHLSLVALLRYLEKRMVVAKTMVDKALVPQRNWIDELLNDDTTVDEIKAIPHSLGTHNFITLLLPRPIQIMYEYMLDLDIKHFIEDPILSVTLNNKTTKKYL